MDITVLYCCNYIVELKMLWMFFCWIQVFEDEERIYLVMELLRGGELLDRILKKESFCEREASAILEVLASTVNYLHENGVSMWNCICCVAFILLSFC